MKYHFDDPQKQYGARLGLKRIEEMQNKQRCKVTLPSSSAQIFYADKKLIEKATMLIKQGKPIIIITDDRDLRVRIKASLESFCSGEQLSKTICSINDFYGLFVNK